MSKTITVKLDDEVHERLVDLAREDDRSLTIYCRRVLTVHADGGYVDLVGEGV